MGSKEKGAKNKKRRSVSKPHPNYRNATLPCYIDCLYDVRDDGLTTSHMHGSLYNKIVLKTHTKTTSNPKTENLEYPCREEGEKKTELKALSKPMSPFALNPPKSEISQNSSDGSVGK